MANKSRTTAFVGVCIALAMVLAYIEVIIPPLFVAVPGIKMGLPNIIIIFLLYRKGPVFAATVSFLRIVLVSIRFGNTMMFLYSIAGGVLSLFVMILLRRLNFLSTIGVSVCGAVSHNIGQILVAMLLLETTELAYYLVVLAVTGTVSGVFIGLCGAQLIKRIPKII